MTKTIYFVNPPDRGMLNGFPGGLLFLDAWLGMTVPQCKREYLDLAASKITRLPIEGTTDNIGQELENYQLESGATYFITSTTATYQNALAVARVLKTMDPSSTIGLGGHHAMHQAEIILYNHPEIDFCGLGEGEQTVQDHALGKSLEETRGIAYRKEKQIIRNHHELLEREELDRFQYHAFRWDPILDSLNHSTLRGQFGYFDLTTSRGCNQSCNFCAFGDQKLRDMTPEAKVRLLGSVSKSPVYVRAKGINIHDNDFAQNSRKTHELCDLIIDERIKICWTAQTRVEHLNDKNKSLVEKLAKAGCVEVYLGVENFDSNLISYLKHISNTDSYLHNIEESVRNVLSAGMKCNLNLQLGVPGENEENRINNLLALHNIAEITATIPTRKQASLEIHPQLSVVYPGTAMAKGKVRGTDSYLPPNAFELFTEWEGKQQISFVKYLLAHFSYLIYSSNQEESIKELQLKALREED